MVLLNDLGDGYPTFLAFQAMLRDYERGHTPTVPPPQPPAPPDAWPRARHLMETVRYVVSTRPHQVDDRPELLGKMYQCQRCGKFFTGGVGASCA